MANRAYVQGNVHWLQGDLSWTTDNVKVALCSASYTPNTASGQDEFLNIIPGGAIVATSANLSGKSASGGAAQAANPTFSSVSGSTITQFVIYNDTGSSATSQLMVLYDTATNMPLVPNGGNITIQWAGAPYYVFAFAYAGLRGRDKALVEKLRDWFRGARIPAELSPGGIWVPTPQLVRG